MYKTVISVENLSKSYQLGTIGTGTFANDLKIWWARQRGKPNPLTKIGETDHGNQDGETLWALKDVSFTVQQGEALGIIGRNGAGKSTLLKVLSRVTSPTSGMVKVKGRIASLLEVGTGFHPELTGRENVYLNGAILGMTRAEVTRKFDEIVDFSGVERFIDTPVKRYSSGMYVRLAFAVAAHLDPEILIVDEVLAVGDAEFQKKCLGKMDEVTHKGRTILFVSHNLQAIQTLCSQAILLSSGKVGMFGETEQVIKSYLSVQKTHRINTKIPESMHYFNNPSLEVIKLEMKNSNKEETDHLFLKESFEITLYYKINKAEDSYRLGLNFRNNEGILLGMVSTLSLGNHIKGSAKTLYKTTFQSVNIFHPGNFTVDITVKNRSGDYVDFISGLSFSVEELSLEKESIIGSGLVVIDGSWSYPQDIDENVVN